VPKHTGLIVCVTYTGGPAAAAAAACSILEARAPQETRFVE